MLLIMVGNIASIFYTSVHCKGDIHIQFLSSFTAYSAIYISFPSLSPCGHFHGYFHLQLSQTQCTVGLLPSFFKMKIQQPIPLQSQVKSQDEHTPFWFAFFKSCSKKCRHSLCWCSQNTRRCTSMLYWHHISCTFDHDNLHHSCIYYTVEYFVAHLLALHYDPISCLCKHFLDLNLYWQVLQFYCLAKQWPPSLSCDPGMICKHHRSFYQVYKYPLKDTSYSLVLSHCSMFYKPASPSVTEQM